MEWVWIFLEPYNQETLLFSNGKDCVATTFFPWFIFYPVVPFMAEISVKDLNSESLSFLQIFLVYFLSSYRINA